jgi:uncharacterized protein YcgI (DUF1989 family)
LRRKLHDFIIPAGHGRALVVPRGAVLRIHLVEDKQVGDCCFFNADDHREVFHVGQSWALNVMLGTGNARSWLHFYSKPPRENVMLTVLEDTSCATATAATAPARRTSPKRSRPSGSAATTSPTCSTCS